MKYLITFLIFFSTMAFAADPEPDGYDDDGDVSPANIATDFFDKQKIPLKSQVMAGNYANIKSCNDIAEVKIPASEIGSRPYGLSVTRNNDTIKMQPKGELFSDVTKIIGVSNGEIYTRNTNLSGNREWGYSLTTTKTTKWLRDNVSVGRPVYFIARYVGNSNLTLGSGGDQRTMPVREGQLVCADILYNK